MRIENAVVSLVAQSSYKERNAKNESLKMWVGDQRPDINQSNSPAKQPKEDSAVFLELSEASSTLSLQDNLQVTEISDLQEEELDISDQDKQKMRLIQIMIESLTGKKIKFFLPEKIKLSKVSPQTKELIPTSPSEAPRRAGWGVEYNYHASHTEQETMHFSSQGTVKTSDGREINFALQLNMSRQFASEQNIQFRAGDAAIDPLVINFDAGTAHLTQEKYSFDLDSDGKAESISFVAPGSGFLSIDLNLDNKINDGTELFGPQSGDGFSDLATYDVDGNQWIDENDPIYDKLRIWTKDDEGRDVLFALGQKGIGAIYLGNVASDFSLKDGNNNTLGQIRKTGVFLRENGSAGTVQHIDLSV